DGVLLCGLVREGTSPEDPSRIDGNDGRAGCSQDEPERRAHAEEAGDHVAGVPARVEPQNGREDALGVAHGATMRLLQPITNRPSVLAPVVRSPIGCAVETGAARHQTQGHLQGAAGNLRGYFRGSTRPLTRPRGP